MSIRKREEMTREELLEENDRLRIDAEISKQEIICLNETIESLTQRLSESPSGSGA